MEENKENGENDNTEDYVVDKLPKSKKALEKLL